MTTAAPELGPEVDEEPASLDGGSGLRRRHRRTAAVVAASVGMVTAGLIFALAAGRSAVDRQITSPLLGHGAPAVNGPSVTPAPFESLASWRGRWLVVNFFATWCIPCRAEQSQFVAFAQRHQASGDAAIVMVIFNDDVGKVRTSFAASGAGWPAVADPDGTVALDFGVTGVPETYLIDPGGTVVAKIVGAVTADGLDGVLRRAKAAGL